MLTRGVLSMVALSRAKHTRMGLVRSGVVYVGWAWLRLHCRRTEANIDRAILHLFVHDTNWIHRSYHHIIFRSCLSLPRNRGRTPLSTKHPNTGNITPIQKYFTVMQPNKMAHFYASRFSYSLNCSTSPMRQLHETPGTRTHTYTHTPK